MGLNALVVPVEKDHTVAKVLTPRQDNLFFEGMPDLYKHTVADLDVGYLLWGRRNGLENSGHYISVAGISQKVDLLGHVIRPVVDWRIAWQLEPTWNSNI